MALSTIFLKNCDGLIRQKSPICNTFPYKPVFCVHLSCTHSKIPGEGICGVWFYNGNDLFLAFLRKDSYWAGKTCLCGPYSIHLFHFSDLSEVQIQVILFHDSFSLVLGEMEGTKTEHGDLYVQEINFRLASAGPDKRNAMERQKGELPRTTNFFNW